MSLKIISYSSALFYKSELSENQEFSTDTDTKPDVLCWKIPLGKKNINRGQIAKAVLLVMCYHTTLCKSFKGSKDIWQNRHLSIIPDQGYQNTHLGTPISNIAAERRTGGRQTGSPKWGAPHKLLETSGMEQATNSH